MHQRLDCYKGIMSSKKDLQMRRERIFHSIKKGYVSMTVTSVISGSNLEEFRFRVPACLGCNADHSF